MNKAIIAGRLGQNPELKKAGEVSVCNFSVATSYKRGDEEQTEWHRIVAFNKSAELICQWMKKGSFIIVEGRLQTRSYEKDGVTHYSTEIVCDRFEFGPKVAPSTSEPRQESSTYTADGNEPPF